MSPSQLPPQDPLKHHTNLSIIGVTLFVIAVVVGVGLALYTPLG